jgi:hypothetical protein
MDAFASHREAQRMTAPTLLFRDTLIFRDTPRVRKSDPITSHQAADSNDISGSARYVLEALRVFGPFADHELVEFYEAEKHKPLIVRHYGGPFTPQRLRTARHELTEQGVVEATGYFHITPSGRKANVWQVTA